MSVHYTAVLPKIVAFAFRERQMHTELRNKKPLYSSIFKLAIVFVFLGHMVSACAWWFIRVLGYFIDSKRKISQQTDTNRNGDFPSFLNPFHFTSNSGGRGTLRHDSTRSTLEAHNFTYLYTADMKNHLKSAS